MKFISEISLALFALIICSQAFAGPARILIIRHGEKTGDRNDIHLSVRGFQRARALSQLFVRQPQLLTYGKPVALIAFNNQFDGSVRGIETATPLSKVLGLNLITSFSPDHTADVSQFIYGNSAFNQKMVMLVWRHSNIQDLAIQLGLRNAPGWDKDTFDRIWQIDYNPQGGVSSFKDIPQHMLPGDSN